jgi:hypothetical protein
MTSETARAVRGTAPAQILQDKIGRWSDPSPRVRCKAKIEQHQKHQGELNSRLVNLEARR